MKFYVRRDSDRNAAGVAFVGPLSERQAEKELAAWADADSKYAPALVPADATAKAFVRRWLKESKRADAWERVTYQGQEMTLAAYRLNHEAA